ncbi:unnamed protein product, partial [Lymnaea stagnalis]
NSNYNHLLISSEMRTLVCFLSAVLLTVRADTDVTITSHWSGGFQGDVCIPVTADIHSWTMTVNFDQPIASMDVWAADIKETSDGGKVYVLTNKAWNKDEHVGEKVCLTFQGHGNGDIVPKATASLDIGGATAGTGVTITVTTSASTTPSTTTSTTTPTTTSTTTPTTTTTTTQAPTTSESLNESLKMKISRPLQARLHRNPSILERHKKLDYTEIKIARTLYKLDYIEKKISSSLCK